MKPMLNKSTLLLSVTFVAVFLSPLIATAQVSQDVLDSISTPNEVETSIGSLKFLDGAPLPETAEKVYDHLDTMRGVDAFLKGMPGASLYALIEGAHSLGAVEAHQVMIFDQLMGSSSLFLTGNTSTMYVVPDLDLEQLREELRGLPCCVKDESAERMGDPLNLALIGDPSDLLAALSRAGWSFTHRITLDSVKRMIGATLSGAAYPVAPVSPLYLLGRQQDVALQRARNTIVQRNHLRLWLAPFRFEERSVWVGQISRDIGIKATTLSPTLTTHVIDPNVDEAREHLLQSLMVAGAIERFAFVQGMPRVSASEPNQNLTGDPYFTDGLRFVVMLSDNGMTPPEDVEFLEWRNSVDPIRDAQDSAPPEGMP